MSFRNSTHQGVRRVVLDNLGDGSVTVEPGVQPDLVECSINAGQEEFLNAVQVRQERDALRISFPPKVFRNTNAHLRLGVPPDLEYVIKVGSADVSVSADIGPSKISSGSGDISVGRAHDLEVVTGSGHVSAAQVGGIGSPDVLRLRRRHGRRSRLPGDRQVRVRRRHRQASPSSGARKLRLGEHHRCGHQRHRQPAYGVRLPDGGRGRSATRLA